MDHSRHASGASHGHTGHDHGHEHGPASLPRRLLRETMGHRHAGPQTDATLESNERGIAALKLSLIALLATALFQAGVFVASGSAGLLAETLHNFSDALTAAPLWVAFALMRRRPDRRFTYGYGRAEDVAGVIIVGVIFASAGLSAWESVRRLLDLHPPGHLPWVMAAAVAGFAGNEAVALFRIRVGREIGSAALVADGQHARIDGLGSLAVLVGAALALAGFPLADPIVGLAITVLVIVIGWSAAVSIWRRLMDYVEPELLEGIEDAAAAAAGEGAVHDVRVRWLGHRLRAELHLEVDEDLPTAESHRLAEEVRHALLHTQPMLTAVDIHIDPCGHGGQDPHHITAHHFPKRRPDEGRP